MPEYANSRADALLPDPPMGAGQPLCGDVDIRIAADGRWYHEGSPIGRHELVCLFASVLKRDAAGDYWLETPSEKARITVEDAPFLAVEMFRAGAGREQVLSFRTNVDEVVSLDAEHPLRLAEEPMSGSAAPYIEVRPGLEARLTRAVYYHLVGLAVFEPDQASGDDGDGDGDGKVPFGVWSDGHFFVLGRLDPEDAELPPA
ncbi:DUF1285 domain-containing protein [Roseospirillum parvum]|uniref:DUF1285 domain-containing protein n=1 Tax=Roseospirillum parvum TaxID=83401 RepID=A0A1G7ZR62_9PROT|nr:DUF1285 domain-containing protein [Roseospirillum parvum]SDH11184.1 hypothetical protein SAMN05421742_104193 [Roseospirillum parvum]